MKKAEKYFEEILVKWEKYKDLYEDRASHYKEFFINEMKQIQEETIRETVQECAENAKLSTKYYTEDDHRMLYLKFKDKGYPRLDGYGMQYAVDIVDIDKNSILSIADKLIKEL